MESLSACTWIRNGQRVAWGGMNAIIPGVGFRKYLFHGPLVRFYVIR